MPLSLDYAKRLLAKVDLKNDPQVVLDRASYWDETPCRLYFEACEDLAYRDPVAALKAAEVAPRLAAAVPEEDSPEGRRRHRDRWVRAHCILGSAYRAVGQHAEARQAFHQALLLARKGLSPGTLALLNRRLAYLEAAENRLKKALKCANRAKAASDGPNSLGAAYTVRGYINVKLGRYSEGVRDFGKSLSIIDHCPGCQARRSGRR